MCSIRDAVILADKEYTEESIRLAANSDMLRSKGFALFVVDQNGGLTLTYSVSGLSVAEIRGLDYYRKDVGFADYDPKTKLHSEK